MVKDIIHLNNYMYVVDKKAKIAKGEWYIFQFKDTTQLYNEANEQSEYYFKVIASTDPSLGLSLLPQIEEAEFSIVDKLVKMFPSQPLSGDKIAGFILGYKAAKAKKYTEENMRNAIKMAKQCVAYSEAANGKEWTEVEFYHEEDEIIKSFNPLPIAVEVEMEYEFKNTPDQQQWQEMSHSEKMEYAVPTVPKVDKNNIIQVKRWIYAK